MEIIGLDLHKRESQLSIKADDGTITDRRIVTSRDRFTAVLGGRPPARILFEASTGSEWVARHLESLGHEVIVADPNCAPMYANRSRRTKTDKRDARTLMDACATGAWRPAYRLSEARRHVRAELAVRDALVRTRTRYIALAKALVRRDGLRGPTSASASVPTRIAERDLSPTLTTVLAPLCAVFAPLNAPGPWRPPLEREQKAEQHLEDRSDHRSNSTASPTQTRGGLTEAVASQKGFQSWCAEYKPRSPASRAPVSGLRRDRNRAGVPRGPFGLRSWRVPRGRRGPK